MKAKRTPRAKGTRGKENKMKLRFLSLTLLFCPLAYAGQLTDAIAKGEADLTANTAVLQQASSAGSEASKHYEHLEKDVLPLIQLTKKHYEDDVTAFNIDRGALSTAIDTHNANQCRQKECAASYDAEKAQLDGQAEQINSRARLLNQRKDNLKIMYDTLSQDTQDTFKKIKDSRASYDQALSERRGIVARLEVLRAESGACKLFLKVQGNGSNEALKLNCGDVQFDGSNANLPPPPPDPPSA
jgi:chromosome segregation ATPase